MFQMLADLMFRKNEYDSAMFHFQQLLQHKAGKLTYELCHEKTCFHICENKGADQLHGKHAADQRICFSYIDSTIPLLLKSKISSL